MSATHHTRLLWAPGGDRPRGYCLELNAYFSCVKQERPLYDVQAVWQSGDTATRRLVTRLTTLYSPPRAAAFSSCGPPRPWVPATSRGCGRSWARPRGTGTRTTTAWARSGRIGWASKCIRWLRFRQGLTLVHFSAQLKRILWERVLAGVVQGVLRRCQGVLRSVSGCSGCILCQKRLRLS